MSFLKESEGSGSDLAFFFQFLGWVCMLGGKVYSFGLYVLFFLSIDSCGSSGGKLDVYVVVNGKYCYSFWMDLSCLLESLVFCKLQVNR